MEVDKKEVANLEKGLQSKSVTKKVEALKKVIEMINSGKNLISLFFPVMNCLELKNTELKKLVYLFLTNYSKDKPNEIMMLVNSFIRDASDRSSPLLRAVAIRTMGNLGIPKLDPYFLDSIKKGLYDDSDYVRRISLASLESISKTSPELIQKEEVCSLIMKLLRDDKNSTILLTAFVALYSRNSRIREASSEPSAHLLLKLLKIIPETNGLIRRMAADRVI